MLLKRMAFVVLAVLLLSTSSVAGVIEESYVKVGGGVIATTSELEEGEFAGTAGGGLIFPLWKHIYGEGDYSRMKAAGPDWSNYGGKVLFFAKNPKVKEMNCYAFMAGTMTHDPDGEDQFGDPGYDIGAGILVPLWGGRWYVEGAGKEIMGKKIWTLTAGVMVGLDPGQ